MSENNNTDKFARIISTLGLLVAIFAVALPYYQASEDEKEKLNIWMRINGGGTVLLPDNVVATSAVQLPWLITLSNTGKNKLSLISYDLNLLEHGGFSKFSGLNGMLVDKDGENVVILPISLDAGESKTYRYHIGYMPPKDVFEHFFVLHKNRGAFTLDEAIKETAKIGKTIYGGKAELTTFGKTNSLVTMSSEFFINEPLYRMEFFTGRNNKFVIETTDTFSKIKQVEMLSAGRK